MKKLILFLSLIVLFSCQKEDLKETVKTPRAINNYEQKFVGKWMWQKSINSYNNSVIDHSNASLYYVNAFIELTNQNCGTENGVFIEKFGNLPNEGQTTAWRIESSNLVCSSYPNQASQTTLISINDTSLVLKTSTFTIYYKK